MNTFSEKIHLTLEAPTEEENMADKERLFRALTELGYEKVQIPLKVLRKIYPLCRDNDWDITVTLVYDGDPYSISGTEREDEALGAKDKKNEETSFSAANTVPRNAPFLITDIEAGDTTDHHYGLAVDLGSTSVVMEMIDLNTGAALAKESMTNRQVEFGLDILTRIMYGNSSPEKLDEIHRATMDTFEALERRVEEKTGIAAAECPVMIVSGNTTMTHFFLNLNPVTVFFAPYAPVSTQPGSFWGEEIGLDFPGRVFAMPSMSNYLGGDITSGLLTTDFYKQDGLSIFFDIGTNGELVVGNREFLVAGAGAAGPALEGDISKFGMRAAAGAIDTVRIDGPELTCTTIEGAKPVGICGSGIIDLLAQMRLNGWINIAGDLQEKASPRIVFEPSEGEGELVAVYAWENESGNGERLYFSQTDIMHYLDTKSAAHTMVDCMLDTAGLEESDIAAYYTAGAFGTYANLESAITVGIFPDIPRDRYHCLGNSSLEGAKALLLDRGRMEDIRYFLEHVYCVQFASIPDFTIRMQASKFIPHTDMRRYPVVAEHIREKLGDGSV